MARKSENWSKQTRSIHGRQPRPGGIEENQVDSGSTSPASKNQKAEARHFLENILDMGNSTLSGSPHLFIWAKSFATAEKGDILQLIQREPSQFPPTMVWTGLEENMQ